MEYKNEYKKTILWALLTIVPFLLQEVGVIDMASHSTYKNNGILSIFTGVVLHESWDHMIGNLLGILLGLPFLIIFYRKSYLYVMTLGYLCPAIFMYMIGYNSIGISGLVYTIIWFVIISGITSSVKEKFYSGILVLVIYGPTLNEAVPPRGFSSIAWQSHLVGLLVAIALILFYKLENKYKITKK